MTLGKLLNEATSEDLTETKSKKLLGDLQVAWNKYKFNLDTKPSEAVKWQEKAYKLWKQVQKMDINARNSAGKLWKDVIDADISVGGRTPKMVKISEKSINYKIDKKNPNTAYFKHKGESFEMAKYKDGSIGIFIDVANHRTHLFDVDAENFDEAIDQFIYRYKG